MTGGGPSSGSAPEPREQGRPADGPRPDEPERSAAGADLSEQQRRRIAEVFGEVLPATTSDERDDRKDTGGQDADDTRFLADRPPHHDRER